MLSVNLYSMTVGYLLLENRHIRFEYDPEFKHSGIELSPFLLPLSSQTTIKRVSEDTFKGLPEFISDALPDHFGNQVINAYLAKKGISKKSITVLDRLSYVGNKAIGALEFIPNSANKESYQTPLEVNKLVQDARSAINGDINNVSQALISIGSSAGGARPKALIGATPGFKKIIAGQHDLPNGFEHFIIKFDGVDAQNSACDPQGYANIEYAYFLMARDAGIHITDCYLLGEGDRQHFVTKRFDRHNNKKIHVQTLCAMTGIDFNQCQSGRYADYFSTVMNLNFSYTEQKEAFRRMVFNVLSVNRDDHTKNFSFTLSSTGKWALAPAYDITHAYNETNPNAWTREHNLLINGKGKDISSLDLLQEGRVLSLKKEHMLAIIECISSSLQKWPLFAAQAFVKSDKITAIQQRIINANTALKMEC